MCPQVAEHCVGCELWGPQKAHQSFLGFDMLVMGKKHMCSDFMSLNGNHKKESPKSKHSNFGMFLW